MDEMLETEWIACCANRLRRHWRTVDLVELAAVAEELSHDRRLRAMPPVDAATEWLKPVACGEVQSVRQP